MGTLVLLLVIILAVTMFSVQNASPVAITFLFWQFQASLAIVIFLSVLSGAIIGAIAMSMVSLTSKRKKKKQAPPA